MNFEVVRKLLKPCQSGDKMTATKINTVAHMKSHETLLLLFLLIVVIGVPIYFLNLGISSFRKNQSSANPDC